MKKKILYLTIFLSLLLSLSSCHIVLPHLNNTDSKLEFSFTSNDKERISKYQNEVEEYLNGTNYNKFYNSMSSFLVELYKVATYRSQAYIKYSMYPTTENNTTLTELNEYLTELSSWQIKTYKKIYNSSFKSTFFSDYTDEEVLEMIGKDVPEGYKELEKENDELLAKYDQLDYTSSEVEEIYRKLVTNYKKEAELYGYDNYLNYAYKEMYDREYSYSIIENYSDYVAKYIIPLYKEKITLFNNYYNNASTNSSNTLYYYVKGSYTSFKSEFESYANAMGSNYYKTYNQFWNNGYYFLGTNASQEGAYTLYLYGLSQPACYFGPGYQNISTVVHEFGHYYSMNVCGGNEGSFDLAETESQGNELLFLAYLDNNNKLLNESLTLIKNYQLSEALQTVILANLVNDFEKYVYQAESLTLLDFDTLFKNLCNKYGGYDTLKELFGGDFYTYWRRVCLDNPLYYISYSVSLIPALSLYQMALNDFNSAKNSYLSIVDNSDDLTFVENVTNAGLNSPFSEESFISISKLSSN